MDSVKSPERSAARQLGDGPLQHPAAVTEQTPAHAAASCAQWLGKRRACRQRISASLSATVVTRLATW